jgi:predicted lipoprotein with Yx(FWY)xxD motif
MRTTPKSIVTFAILAIGTMLVTACGSNSTATSSSGSASSTSSTVHAQQIAGVGSVLVDSKGFTLYVLSGESATSIKCTGSCATNWPPLTVPSGAQPTAGSGVSGKLSTVQRPDGSLQVTYNGMPLYTFVGDSGPGQATGQGVANFSIATATATGGGAGGSGSSGGYGSGY